MTDHDLTDAISPAMAAKMAAYWGSSHCARSCRSAGEFAKEMVHRYPGLAEFAGADGVEFGERLYDAAMDAVEEAE